MSLRLLSGPMPDDEIYAKRLGFWLRMARERAGKSQAGAAEYLGFSSRSKSTISDYENGVTVPSLKVLRRLAAWYGVPLTVFIDPQPTIEEQLDEIVRLAGGAEREDWAAGLDRGREDGDGPAAAPGRRSA